MITNLNSENKCLPAKAVLFPGQGAQRYGMGLDFLEKFKEARDVFEIAEKILPFNVLKLFREETDELHQTEYTQPCLLTVEIAIYEVLKAHYGLAPSYFGGHSLGEYTALVAAGVIPLEAALEIVHYRGKSMQEATPRNYGSMAALIMNDLPLNRFQEDAHSFSIDIANDNSKSQIVTSGETSALNEFCTFLRSIYEEKIKIIPLAVSAPFHSRHMKTIADRFTAFLDSKKNRFNKTNLDRVLSNQAGTLHGKSIEDLISSLTQQVYSRVRWQENMKTLLEKTNSILEIGPNNILSRFLNSFGVSPYFISDLRTLQRTLRAL